MTLTPFRIDSPGGPGRPGHSGRQGRPGGALGDLARYGDLPAVRTSESMLTYEALAARVRARAEELGPVRRLVLLECGNDLETVTTYLAALEGEHPVLLTGRNADVGRLTARYRPDVVATADGLQEQRAGTRHRLHPDLALLLSTSGSTGAPKLVRLSAAGLRANAESIATYLQLDSDDLAATTLPLHYCYGLSVLNSHLVRGAGVLLTERSVVDDEFWDDFGSARATSFAGVPYTFELLDSTGFAERDLPSLRYITSAGGRLDPERVRRFARLGRQRGFDLVVMYGQTEATARMAYLPPHLAEARPTTIGVPVPGGSFRIDTDDTGDTGDTGDAGDAGDPPQRGPVGELVYSGPNVMLGYATSAHDLSQGRTVRELRTGDLAVRHEDGLYEVVGRRSRFAKVFGLRVDLDDLERRLEADHGWRACAVEDDGRVTLFVTRHLDVEPARRTAARAGLPPSAVRAHVVAAFPLTDSSKVDYAALARHAEVLRGSPAAEPTAQTRAASAAGRGGSGNPVRDLYAELLGRPDATDGDSFVSLRGDSLSFVEASVRLEELLGVLPERWPELSAHRLAALAGRRSRWPRVEVPLLLRAVAIALVVATHANLVTVMGGAHVLLAVAGANLARFQLSGRPRAERRQSLLRAAREIAVPSALWIGGVTLIAGTYDLGTAALANNLLGSPTWDVRWQFWFLEAVVWSLVGAAMLVSVPALDRLERRHPCRAAVGVLALTLALRYALVGVHAGPTERYALPVVLWCLALGWLAVRCQTTTQRVLATAAAAVGTYGFFGDVVRETLVVSGIAALVWVRSVRVPRVLLRPVTLLASSSLFVYLTHWQVYPHLEVDHPLLATLASFAVGIATHRAYSAMRTPAARRLRTLARRAPSPTGPSLRRWLAPR